MMADARETNAALYDTAGIILERHSKLDKLTAAETEHTFVYDPESRQRYANFARGILDVYDKATVDTVRLMGSRMLDVVPGSHELQVLLEDLGGYIPRPEES